MTDETAEEILNRTSATGITPAPHLQQVQMQAVQSVMAMALEFNRACLRLNPLTRHLVS